MVRFLQLILISTFFTLKSFGQTSSDLDELVKKYPDNPIIINSLKKIFEIDMSKGKPDIKIHETKELLALNDNANFFANSKEFFGGTYQLKKIEGYTLVPEKGKYKKIPVKSFNKTAEISDYSFFDDIYSYNFTFPSVIKGAKMVADVTTVSEDPSFPYKFYFGDYFPCKECSFTIVCPENVEIRYKLFGQDTASIQYTSETKSGKKIYTWTAVDRKAYTGDEFTPSIEYYMPHIIIQVSKYTVKGETIQVIGSLKDLYSWNYKKISRVNQAESEEIKALTDSLTRNTASDYEKVRQIYRWVQNNIKYVAFEDGDNGYVPREAGLVLKRKYGDCKDKTSILVSMMKSIGLKASYAWVGSRDIPYKNSEFATGYNINHVVAVWWKEENTPVILDGTTQNHTMEDIPAFIQGQECIIDKGPDDFMLYQIPVAKPESNLIYDSLHVELKGDTLIGSGISLFKGEKRALMLDYFDGKNTKDLPKVVVDQMPKASNKFIIDTVIPVPLNNPDDPFSYKYRFYLPDYLTSNHTAKYLNLNLDRFPSFINLKEDRWMPVEIKNTMQNIFVCCFTIPDGYEVHELPEDSSFENPLYGFTQHYKRNERIICVKTIVNLNFHVIEGTEMSSFTEMLNELNRIYLKSLPMYKTVAQ